MTTPQSRGLILGGGNSASVEEGKGISILRSCLYSRRTFERTKSFNFRFGQFKSFSFDPASSCAGCSDEDEVTIINVPLLTIVDKVKES